MLANRNSGKVDLVYAVVVTEGNSPDLYSILDGALTQSLPPNALILVTVGNDPETTAISRDLSHKLGSASEIPTWVINVPSAKNFGEAIRQALTSESIQTTPNWFWLLHDDSLPEPNALFELMAQGTKGGTIALVGPKQVDWDEPDLVLEVGIEATKSARRIDLLNQGEIDQGQYDDRGDVLALGTAGMLVRGEVWNHVRGFDPFLGPFGDGLEFGRRVRRAGYRVVVAPKARIRHRQQSLNPMGQRHKSFKARRTAQLYNWLLALASPAVLPAILFLAFWTVLRGVGRILTRSPRLAAAELGAFLDLVLGIPALGKARRRHRRLAAVPRSAVAELELTPGQFASRRSAQRKAHRSRPRDSEQIDSLASRAWKQSQKNSRLALLTLTAILAVASFYVWYPYLGGLSGADWANLPADWNTLWAQAWSPWVLGGDGAPGPTNPLLPLFAVISAPFALFGANPNDAALGTMVLALPLAGLGGWIVASVFTRSLPLRIGAATLWASQPGLLLSLTAGNLGAVVAWIALPLLFVSIWRATRPLLPVVVEGVQDIAIFPRPDPITWAGIGSLALLIAGSGAPILVGGTAGVLFLLIFLPTGRIYATSRQKNLKSPGGDTVNTVDFFVPFWQKILASAIIVLPAAVVTAPSWAWSFTHWRVPTLAVSQLVAPTGANSTVPLDVWAMLGLFPSAGLGPLAVVLAGGISLVAALAGLVASTFGIGRYPWIGRVSFFVGVLVLGFGGLLAGRSAVWIGPLLSVVALAWMVTGLCSVPEAPIKIATGSSSVLTRFQRASGVIFAVSGTATFVTLMAFGSFADPTDKETVQAAAFSETPMVAAQAQASGRVGRLLVLRPQADLLQASLWRGNGVQLVDLSWGLRTTSNRAVLDSRVSLAEAVGTLAARPSSGAAAALSAHAVDLVLLPSDGTDATEIVFGNLNASEGLERIGTTEAGTMWRIRPNGELPARVTLVGASGRQIVQSNAASVRTSITVSEDSVLVLAESADLDWRATFGGVELESIADPDSSQGWRQAFVVPPGQGILKVWYAPPWSPWWLAGAGLLSGVALVAALPWQIRRSQWVILPAVEGV